MRVPSAGTDNATYRLGDDMAARLPRIHWAIDNVAKERQWLPILAPQFPLAVPLPIAVSEPDDAFPYPWSVVQRLPGTTATLELLDDATQEALDIAAFARALVGNGAVVSDIDQRHDRRRSRLARRRARSACPSRPADLETRCRSRRRVVPWRSTRNWQTDYARCWPASAG